ncbi:MAG: hypothetical protein NVSMB5_14160 [Candidatus Velthaea sp.]
MQHLLPIGQTLETATSHLTCTIEEHLGGGGQGEVYRGTVGDFPIAIKWYATAYLDHDRGLHRRIASLVAAGAPSQRFLWPMDIVRSPDLPSFGYIMALRQPDYRVMAEVISRAVEPSFRSIATASLELADAFLRLHAQGLSYRDVSENNVFIDVDSGEIAICDNDNVDVNGCDGAVAGTWRYMAPEIGLHQASPSTQTDLYSLSVLLFLVLMLNHPLDGARENAYRVLDQSAMRRLYAEDPLFIFDPADASNRPVPGVHDNALLYWPFYPRFLREMFTRAFTEGLCNPAARVREGEWRQAMIQLRDSIFSCAHCEAENIYDEDRDGLANCWECNVPLAPPLRIRLDRSAVTLEPDVQLYAHHIGMTRYDFSSPLAVVDRHPVNPDIWGLKNLGSVPWEVTLPDGRTTEIVAGRSIKLRAGTRIDFRHIAGTVIA